MKICIVSDIHFKFTRLDPEEQQRHKLVLDFFRECVGKYDLFILNGDIFDLWSETSHTIIKQYFPLLRLLADIHDAGCKIVYISGNHDFWFGDFFADILPVEIHQDAYKNTCDGKRILVTHGDLHTVNDVRYRIFRSTLRTSLVRKLYGFLHPELGLQIGSRLSRSSNARRVYKDALRLKKAGLQSFAEHQIKLQGYDIVVLGHSHHPLHLRLDKGEYLNCGDWMKNFTYINIIDGFAELCNYAHKPE